MKDDGINREKRRCGNVFPRPSPPGLYWSADKPVTHAHMRDVMAIEGDSEVIDISLHSQRK